MYGGLKMCFVVRVFLSVIIVAGINGCAWLNAPYLYGNDSCGDKEKTAYVYSNGKAAICLNEKSVAYMLCARELAIITDTKRDAVSGSIEVPDSQVPGKVGGAVEVSSDITYADGGELGKARARAIDTCIAIYNEYM